LNDDLLSIHSAAAQGYQNISDVYESGRPDFPPEAISFLAQTLAIQRESCVLDLAAGTGKLTRCLVPLSAYITAVEPVESMGSKFTALLPKIPLLSGTAEAIPLRNESMDVVLVATAFHWFDGEKALIEIHRVLKPGGRLGLLWNVRDESKEWVAEMMNIVEPHAGGAPRYKSFIWKKAFEQTVLFTPLKKASFPFIQKGNLKTVLDRVRSISFISALEEEAKNRILAEVKKYLENRSEIKNSVVLEIPYHTDIYWCFKHSQV
jgi:ubiquinone/menaquinone biosynthesis C-methylase UbiE